jgi:6-pyruvoyltetrahydropterin/6-carboxytetrahydropterin synthase
MQGVGIWRYHVEVTFEAAHSAGPPGHKCHTLHGHSFVAEAEGEYRESSIDAYGWGPDFGKLKDVIRPLDHQNLNELELLQGMAPTSENLTRWIYQQITDLTGLAPDFVRLHEGRGNVMTYREFQP